jgi:glucoamylase
MVRRAAAFLVCNGPVSPQDRWEEEPGYAPFAVATEVAGLVVAADLPSTSNCAGHFATARFSIGHRRPSNATS